MWKKILFFLKRSKLIRKVYQDIKIVNDTSIPEITPVEIRESQQRFQRINLLLPSINREHVFGGIVTALSFFNAVMDAFGETTRYRIILTDTCPDAEALERFHDWTPAEPGRDADDKLQILPFNDRYQKTIPVNKHDKFIATAWWTAYAVQTMIKRQSELFNQQPHPMVYFIQDYEPGFYNWSSRYILADSTYKSDIPTIAVFNTSLLQEYFKKKEYVFYREFYFNPQVNTGLKKYLDLNKNNKFEKKKQILVYGRPSVPRNAFSLIVESLKKWVWMQPDISEWSLISAGEAHPDIDLGNGKTLTSVGKLSLEDYAAVLSESAVGLSLMVSPHPSYPPLEMAHFGLKTITNNYANKNLSCFHKNIIAAEKVDPAVLAQLLLDQCNRFCENGCADDRGPSENREYFSSKDQFEFVSDIKALLDDQG